MSDMPERIWASNTFDSWSESDERWNGENTEYIRADIAEQHLRELEAALSQMKEEKSVKGFIPAIKEPPR